MSSRDSKICIYSDQIHPYPSWLLCCSVAIDYSSSSSSSTSRRWWLPKSQFIAKGEPLCIIKQKTHHVVIVMEIWWGGWAEGRVVVLFGCSLTACLLSPDACLYFVVFSSYSNLFSILYWIFHSHCFCIHFSSYTATPTTAAVPYTGLVFSSVAYINFTLIHKILPRFSVSPMVLDSA